VIPLTKDVEVSTFPCIPSLQTAALGHARREYGGQEQGDVDQQDRSLYGADLV
jgi:hypothetical protein